MKKIFGALAALVLALVIFAPPAEAHCWWNGYRWHCSYYRHYVRHWHPYRYYGYYPYPYTTGPITDRTIIGPTTPTVGKRRGRGSQRRGDHFAAAACG